MAEAFIYDAVRTPRGRGRASGALHTLNPLQLMGQLLAELRKRSLVDTALVDDVILGCVTPVREQGSDIGRLAVLVAGYAESVAGAQVNRFCASGLEACNIAAAKVIAGEARFAIGGGVEMMSRVPMGGDDGPLAVDPHFAYDHLFVPQGVSADILATLYSFSRDDVDIYAVESQRRAGIAWAEGRFRGSVCPVFDQAGTLLLDYDELVRPNTTKEVLAVLKPSFEEMGKNLYDAVGMQRYPELQKIDHVHHPGNSSGIVDGAAAVLIGSDEAGRAAGLKPRARIRGMASVGSEPTIMLTGPGVVTRKLLSRLGMEIDEIDLFELNEAFAAVVLRYMQEFGIPRDRINVNGGAIAMGHPLGATGAMILGTVLDELERRDLKTALVVLCVGAGMGTATVIERV